MVVQGMVWVMGTGRCETGEHEKIDGGLLHDQCDGARMWDWSVT